MTASSVPAPDHRVGGAVEPPDVSTTGSAVSRERLSWLTPLLLGLLVGVMAAIMFASHRPGHWWGDDWALYLRQAQSLVDGNPGAVTADNHFTVERSLGAPFSPPLYPWGFPVLLAPFVAVVGIDVDALTVVPVLSACVFACAWFALARRRLGPVVAFVGTAAATLTPLLLSWSELIQSELSFLAVAFVMLVAVDRAIESRVLVDDAARWWPVIALGVGTAVVFSFRREGLALAVAIAAAQLALLTTGRPGLRDAVRDGRLRARLIAPHLSALAAVLVLQLLLPSTLVPRYSGTSFGNVWAYADKHVRHLAEISGLKHQWDRDPIVLGSTGLGWAAIAAYLAIAAVGIGLAVTVHRRRDLHLAVFALVALVIGGSPRAALNRYLAVVGPALFLLGLVALATALGPRRAHWGRAIAITAAMAIVAGNLVNARARIENAERAVSAEAIEWGPTHPDAIAMFDVVSAATDRDDIVAGPKARALTLITDRRSIQVDQWRPLPGDWSPSIVVAEVGSSTETELRVLETERYVELWSNRRFAVFESIEHRTARDAEP